MNVNIGSAIFGVNEKRGLLVLYLGGSVISNNRVDY